MQIVRRCAHSATFLRTMSFFTECYAPSGALKVYREGEWLESSSGKTVGIFNPSRANEIEFKVQGEGSSDNERRAAAEDELLLLQHSYAI